MLPPICILAGGLGTRLGSATDTTPKPLLDVAGEPFLTHQIRLLAEHGADRVVLCVGYLGDKIEERIGYVQDGVTISYSYDSKDLDGTLGAIRRARPLLGGHFLILYGDTYLQIDYGAFANAWLQSDRLGAMSVLRNNNNLDKSNVIYRDGEIVLYDKSSPLAEMQWIDYGLGGLHESALDLVGPEINDLAYLYNQLSLQHQLFGYEATTRFYEIGTPDSLRETDAMLRTKTAGS